MNSKLLPPLLQTVHRHASDPGVPSHAPLRRELDAVAEAIDQLQTLKPLSPVLKAIRDLPTVTGTSDDICKCCGQEIQKPSQI
jgi:hypothetical protein